MKAWIKQGVLALAGGVLGLGLAVGHNVLAERSSASQVPDLPIDDLRTFAEVFGRIKRDYVEPVDDKVLLEHAIEGMLAGLDPHSSYLSPDDFKELQIGTSGEFGGLGIEVGMENGFVKVIAPIDDTPAARAGMKSGDLIIRLDDKPVKGMSLNEAVSIMRGKPETSIVVTIVREGEDKPLRITIVRDIIKVQSVRARMLDPGFAYVRISNFQSHTGEDMVAALGKLKTEAGGALKGVVLDLRNNPGGVLNSAVTVSDAFLDHGLIVYTEGRVEDSKLRFEAAADDVIDGAPIVVLVNGGSASASEIVAGALQDQKRAIIMGQKTFGKGSVQTIVPVRGQAAVKLTTARYYTPSGRSIQASGITPDIELVPVKVAGVDEPEVKPLKEAQLNRALSNENGAEELPASGSEKDGADKPAEKPLAERDYQLHEALNLLKGLYILQARHDAA